MSLCSLVGKRCVKLGVVKEWEFKGDIAEGLNIRSEEWEFLLHIGNGEPLDIIE